MPQASPGSHQPDSRTCILIDSTHEIAQQEGMDTIDAPRDARVAALNFLLEAVRLEVLYHMRLSKTYSRVT